MKDLKINRYYKGKLVLCSCSGRGASWADVLKKAIGVAFTPLFLILSKLLNKEIIICSETQKEK